MDAPFQVWIGNIPSYLVEESALHELALCDVRPYKLVLRTRGESRDSYAIAYFATAALAAHCMREDIVFSNRSRALCRSVSIHVLLLQPC